MRRAFCEVPFYKEESKRFIPIITGFLIAFLMLFNFFSSSINEHFRYMENNTLRFIVEAPNAESENIVNYLKKMPFVTSVKILDQDHVYNLLSCWIPDAELLSDLPFPIFVDIQLSNSSDISILEKSLKSFNEQIKINDFTKWDQTFFKLSNAVKKLITIFSIIIFMSVGILISLISKSSISFHKELLNTLRLIGIKPRHLASLFQKQALFVLFLGWIVGFFIFCISLFFLKSNIVYFALEPFIKTKSILKALIPSMVACILCSFVSRFVVLRYLCNLEK